MRINVNTLTGKTFTVNVESRTTIYDVKFKIEGTEGVPFHEQRLIYESRQLEDEMTLADYNIRHNSSLTMVLRLAGPPIIDVAAPNGNTTFVVFNGSDRVRDVKAQLEMKMRIPLDNHALFVPAKRLQDYCTLDWYGIRARSTIRLVRLSDVTMDEGAVDNAYEAKLKTTEMKSKLISEGVRPGASSSELEDATAICKLKELEDTVSKLRHKNKVVSARCASYERQLAALETENKKIKLEVIQGQAFVEGEKAKWLKSVEYLDHLTEGALQYFDYGFDSCQKQAEQQGFVGQLNKDAALKEAPELKGCELN